MCAHTVPTRCDSTEKACLSGPRSAPSSCALTLFFSHFVHSNIRKMLFETSCKANTPESVNVGKFYESLIPWCEFSDSDRSSFFSHGGEPKAGCWGRDLGLDRTAEWPQTNEGPRSPSTASRHCWEPAGNYVSRLLLHGAGLHVLPMEGGWK